MSIADSRSAGQTSHPPGSALLLCDAYESLDDDLLVDRTKNNDERAFETLMRRYNRRLFRIARSILRDDDAAEDAVQETYISAFTKLDRYAPTGRFSAWLSKVAMNEALMLKRGLHADTFRLDSFDEDAWVDPALHMKGSAGADPSESVHARQLLELAVDALPQAFRIVFMLRIVEGLSIGETAECLSLNEATVKTRLHRACRALHRQLSERLRRERLNIFEFGGARCDRIVRAVLVRCVSPATHPP
jgi:RNA polymerase sigma-70 factor, ECF subfamily